MQCNKNKTGLVFGIFAGFGHLLWSLSVALGLAQPILNFIYLIHFLNNPYQVAPFGFKRMAALVVITSIVGYIVGWVFAFFWNKLHKQPAV